jgi:murein DD-endopeptidase MepM/ murein hydrolase activator NlpD
MSKIDSKVGQKIKRGQIIGYVGSTGYSTCPHVHYEVFVNDIRVNPMPYISRMSNDELKEIAKSVNPDVSFGPNNRNQRRRP